GDTYYFGPRAFFVLRDSTPQAEWVDIGLLVNQLKTIKTPREIEFMRRAGLIVNKVMGVAIECLRPGIRENDFAARVVHAQVEGVGEYGGSFPGATPFIL